MSTGHSGPRRQMMLRLTRSQACSWQMIYRLGQTDAHFGHTVLENPFCSGSLARLAWRTGWQAERTGKPAVVEFVIVEEVEHAILSRVL